MKKTWIEETPEVFYTGKPVSTVSQDEIEMLKKIAVSSPRRQARLCTHLNTTDAVHEMIIVHSRGNYVRPHRHMGKIESFHVVEGRLNVMLFEDDGRIRSVIRMAGYGSGKIFYYRLSKPLFHTVVPVSDMVVFHEITNGPFNPSENCFAPWSPDENDSRAASFQRELLIKSKDHS